LAWDVASILAGLCVLTLGADWLVRGAAQLAVLSGVPPIAVGLTVVAFGTSTPELVVSVQGAWTGNVDAAVGNVVGSNIFNVGVILGLAAAVCPIPCHPAFVRREVPLMIAAVALVWPSAYVHRLVHGETAPWMLERWGGAAFLGLLALYTTLKLIRVADRDEIEKEVESIAAAKSGRRGGVYAAQVGMILVGLLGLVVGAKLFLDGALGVARALGVGELVIGLTLVAAGTSLPELATSVVAALRGRPEISIGNVVGSNVFNVFGVLGASALIRPLPLNDAVVQRDLPVAAAFSLLCLPIMATGGRIGRLEGVLLLGLYAAYTLVLIRTAGQ
jgi:cation:H+ antiporter